MTQEQASAQAQMPPIQPKQKSWFGRNCIWVVPVGCLTPVILCGGFGMLIVSILFGALKSSDAYKQSLAQVQANPVVQEALGTPIEAGFFVGGNIEVKGGFGSAQLSYSVSGPNGEGTVYVEGEKQSGQWVYSTMTVRLPTNEIVDLLEETPAEI